MRTTNAHSTMTKLVASLAIVLLPTVTNALSCAQRVHTLEEAYASADSIIVGVVTECGDETSDDMWTPGGQQCAFSVVEVLKDTIPVRDYSGVSDSAACGLALFVGQQYLLFLDGNNAPLYFSEALDGDGHRVQQAQQYRQQLRDYRDGKLQDLSEPWSLFDQGNACMLTQIVGGNLASFVVQRTSAFTNERPTWSEERVNGQTVHRTQFDVLEQGTNTFITTMDIVTYGEPPDMRDGVLIFKAQFREESPEALREAVLTVGDVQWPLQRVEVRLLHPAAGPLDPIVDYFLHEKDSQHVLDVLSQPRTFRVAATLVNSQSNGDPELEGSNEKREELAFRESSDAIRQVVPNTGVASDQFGVTLSTRRSVQSVGKAPDPVLQLSSKSTYLAEELSGFRACIAALE